jgi:hypothetical protein
VYEHVYAKLLDAFDSSTNSILSNETSLWEEEEGSDRYKRVTQRGITVHSHITVS